MYIDQKCNTTDNEVTIQFNHRQLLFGVIVNRNSGRVPTDFLSVKTNNFQRRKTNKHTQKIKKYIQTPYYCKSLVNRCADNH